MKNFNCQLKLQWYVFSKIFWRYINERLKATEIFKNHIKHIRHTINAFYFQTHIEHSHTHTYIRTLHYNHVGIKKESLKMPENNHTEHVLQSYIFEDKPQRKQKYFYFSDIFILFFSITGKNDTNLTR